MDPINGMKPTQRSNEQVLKLPDGNIIIVGEEATSAPELMFKPELAKKSYSGLHELIYESIMKCEGTDWVYAKRQTKMCISIERTIYIYYLNFF